MNKQKGTVRADFLIVIGSQPGRDPRARLGPFRGFALRFRCTSKPLTGKSSGLRELAKD